MQRILLTLIFVVGVASMTKSEVPVKSTVVDSTRVVQSVIQKQYNGCEFTIDNLVQFMEEIGIQHPKIVLKQAILETGWFKSNAFKKKNNLFGLSNKNGPKTYKHWTESVKAYKSIQDRRLKTTHLNYYDFLNDMNYAEDPHYIKKLKLIKVTKFFE